MCVFKYSLVIFGKTNHRKLWVSKLTKVTGALSFSGASLRASGI